MSCCDKKKNHWRLAVWLAVVLGVASFAILSDALGEPVPTDSGQVAANATCPVTTDEKVDPGISTTYNGREVYFCCQRCKRKFEHAPQAYVSNLPANYFTVATSREVQSITLVAASEAGGHGHGGQGYAEASVASGTSSPPLSGETAHPEAEGGQADDHSGHPHGGEVAAEGDADSGHADGGSDGHHAPGNTSGDSSSEGGAHDHSAHGQDESQGLLMHLIGWLGNLHPPSVNFPVALMTAALIAEMLFIATGRPLFDAAGRFTVWFAIVGTIGAVILGWFFGGFKLVDDDWIMTTHRWVGTAAGLWAFVLAWYAGKEWSGSQRNPARSRRGYRMALFVGTSLVSANGFFGGALIYGIDHYLW